MFRSASRTGAAAAAAAVAAAVAVIYESQDYNAHVMSRTTHVHAVVRDSLLHDELAAAADVARRLMWSERVQHRLTPASRQVDRTPTTPTTATIQTIDHHFRPVAVYPDRRQTLWTDPATLI